MSLGTSPLFAAGILTDPDAGKAAGTGLLGHRGWDFTEVDWSSWGCPILSSPNRRPGHPLDSRPTPPSWAVPLDLAPFVPPGLPRSKVALLG